MDEGGTGASIPRDRGSTLTGATGFLSLARLTGTNGVVSVDLSTGAAVWTGVGAGGGGTTGFGEAIGDGPVICTRITATNTLPHVALTTTVHRGRRAFDRGTGGNSIFRCRRAAGSPRTDGEIEEGRTDVAACSRRPTPGSSDSNCRSGSSSPEVAGEVCRFFFGRNCRSSGCIVFERTARNRTRGTFTEYL